MESTDDCAYCCFPCIFIGHHIGVSNKPFSLVYSVCNVLIHIVVKVLSLSSECFVHIDNSIRLDKASFYSTIMRP